MIEYLQLGTTVATISLSIALGTLTIISNQSNVYHLILTISSFIIPLYSIIPIIYSNVITISIQLIFSIFNIISGILFIINVPHKQLYYIPITIIFIVNLVFLIASFIMLLLWVIILKTGLTNSLEESEIYLNDLISKKTSEATLYNTNPAAINNIKPSSEYSMENDWINSKDKITLALPPNATPINCDFSYYLGSNANSIQGELDNERSILMVNLEDQDTKANQHLRRQRWKSIHDEKIMIANLNQNLLPGVLKQNIPDDYNNTLTGLENIPSSTNITNALVKNDGTPTNIPEINMEELNNLQQISGYNIVDGSSNLVDGSRLFDKKTVSNNEVYQAEYLLPPKEVVENIDQLSDITSKRPSILNRSFSEPSLYENGAPSLYTFRKLSSPKANITPVSTNLEEELQTKLAPEPKTPPPQQQQQQQSRSRQQSTRTSPIRKFLHDSSPKRVFKSRSVVVPSFHKHSNSTISNTMSLKSSFSSSRSTSPKKLKSILKLHKHSTSVPNFQFHDHSWSHSHPHQPQHSWYFDKYSFHSSHPLKVITEPIDLWDIQTTNFDINDVYEIQPVSLAQPPAIVSSSSSQPKVKGGKTKEINNEDEDEDEDEDDHHKTNQESRISSLPSQVFGEYDKEKWDTLKTLGNENSHTVVV